MLRQLASHCLLVTSFAFFSTGAEAVNYVWQGEAVVTAATAACSAGTSERTKIAVGTVLKTLVRPRLLGTNGNDSRIAFLHDTQSEFAAALAGGLTIAGAGTFAAYGVTTSGVIKTNVGGTYRAFALSPAAPTTTTPFLSLTGRIEDFMFVSGCDISFRAQYALRP